MLCAGWIRAFRELTGGKVKPDRRMWNAQSPEFCGCGQAGFFADGVARVERERDWLRRIDRLDREHSGETRIDRIVRWTHHDSPSRRIMTRMRTTVTLDPDVESLLRQEVRRRGEPFKQVLNNALRAGLRGLDRRSEGFEPLTFDMGKPRVDLTKAMALASELEDDELADRLGRR